MQTDEQQRLDKWLWVARFFKTRSLAAEAISGGKVHLNGERVKPSRSTKAGDYLQITRGQFEFNISVVALNKNRRPANEAQLLYNESEESIEKRKLLAQSLKMLNANRPHSEKRPSKKQRRQIVRFKRVED
jgi:ribosome-associated heat shock protein Hsp15